MVLGAGDWVLENLFSDYLNALVFPFPTSSPAPGTQHPAPHLAIAVSGGADSMALTLLADQWARAHGTRITALTVDHALRAESRSEAEQVATWLRARGIEHHILTPAHTDASNNLQESARNWRYDALADFCRAHDILHCLIAHHAGDQRETIALHTARGDTADGASGMAAARNYRGVRFLRPLLGTEKSALTNYLHHHHAEWIDDPSNQNTDFARVRIRQQLASDVDVKIHLTATARHEGEARASREETCAQAALRCVTIHPAGFAELMRSTWQTLEPTLMSGLLADLLTTISGATHRPRASDTARLIDDLLTTTKKRTLHGCEITTHGDKIRIAREFARVATPITLSGKGTMQWDDRFRIQYDLPAGTTLTLQALGKHAAAFALPAATPSLWHLDALAFTPHIHEQCSNWLAGARATIGFAPAKPLAAAPFWWLKD